MGPEWYGGWSGTGGGVVRGVEWYERTERKKRGIRALKGCKSRQESQDGRCVKSCCRRIMKTKSIDIDENVNENLDNVFLWPR